MKILEINKKLNEKVERVYNIIGSDAFLIKNAINNIKAFCIKDLEEFNFITLTDEKVQIGQLDAMLSTLPIGNDYHVVLLENATTEVVNFINKYNFDESTVLITINATNLKVGEVVDCTKLDKTDITRYILNYLNKANLKIVEPALDYLIESTSGNMSLINNELNKIAAYCAQKDVVELKDVITLVANTTEYASYMLNSAIDNKDYSLYQKVLSQMTKNITAGELFSYLGKYFRRMQYICINKNDEELASILNIKPYAIKMSRKNIAKNGINYYLGLYEKYTELDYKIKSGKITPINALYELIF